jgi:hypothetical protein
VIAPVADADILPAAVATWTAPAATATDDTDADISGDVTLVYSSADVGSAVTDLASARTHLGTVGNTVTVTYSVSDAATNAATDEVAVFTAIAAPVEVAPTPVIDYAALAAANAANLAAEAAKVAAAKAAAEKVIADKLASEKAAADKLIADAKAAAEAQVIAEAKAKADTEAAAVVAAVAKVAATNAIKKITLGKVSTKIALDLADKYYGDIVYIEVRTKTKTGFKTTIVDFFVVMKENGTLSVTTKKLSKGQTLRVRVGNQLLISKKL